MSPHATPPTPATHPAGALPPGGIDVWERWLPAWHVYNALVVVLTGLLALVVHTPSATGMAISLVLLATLVLAYVQFWVRRVLWNCRDRLRVAYAALILGSFAVLILVSPQFEFLQFSLYAQLFFSLPRPRLAIAAGLSVGLILAIAGLVYAGGNVGAALPDMAAGIAQGAAFTMLSAWIGAIIAQSGERRVILDQLAAARAELASAEREASVQEERARLSREIHDTLAQGFASVVTHLEAADAVLAADAPRAREHMHAAQDVARSSLDEARRLVWALRPRALEDGGLPAALERAAASAATGATGAPGPAVDVTISGQVRPLHPDVEVTLLRSAQEGLANALRHAKPAHVTLTLTYFDDAVSLDVIDDGAGFDPDALAEPGPAGGHGIPGMRERAERLGGRLDVESAPGEGTAIALQLPAPTLAAAPA